MDRAYSLLQIKSFDDEQRVIMGIATTPTPDRVGDIVEPLGVTAAGELPLFLYHDSAKTVGIAKFGKATKSGIPFEARLPRIAEAGTLRDRVEEAWQMVKYGLIKGVSIGFRVLQDGVEPLKNGGLRFLATEVMELSLVPVPANAEATITAIKTADRAQRAASGHQPFVRVDCPQLPGASGNSTPKGTGMKTYQEQITALENKRAAAVAARDAIQQKAISENRTKEPQEKDEFEGHSADIEAIDAELVDLRKLEKSAVSNATVVTPQAGTDPVQASRSRGTSVEVRNGFVRTNPNIEPGVRFARAAMALIQAKGNRQDAAAIVRGNQRWMDQSPDVELYLKTTAIPAGDTTTSGWASQLAYAQDMASEFVEFLRPMTILGKLQGVRRVPFNIRYGTQTAGVTGNWVGQGAPVPVGKPTVSSGSLGIAKASTIVAIDEELARLSTPSAEMLVRDDLARGVSTFLDVQFVDPNVAASANVNPASITNGVTATVSAGTSAANLRTDLAALLTAMARNEIDISTVVWIMCPETALTIQLMLNSLGLPLYDGINVGGGTLLGRPVITSNSANIPGSPLSGRMLIAVAAPEILLADDGQVSIDVSREASLELLDIPTNTSTGGTTATAMVSMFQTHSLALRATRYINWAKRRTTAVEYLKETAYAA